MQDKDWLLLALVLVIVVMLGTLRVFFPSRVIASRHRPQPAPDREAPPQSPPVPTPTPTPTPEPAVTNQAALVTSNVIWNYDLSQCPIGQKVQLLTTGFTAIYGYGVSPDKLRQMGVIGFAALPDRDKQEEQRRGYL